MNISIKNHIMNNFKGASKEDIKESIVSSFNDKDEITLPDLGCFLELFGIKVLMKKKIEFWIY